MSNHPVDAHVGKRLLLRRNTLGMSQEEVGSAVGVTFQQVQKYERGANRIGAGRLHDLAKILRVSVSYFYEGYEAASGKPGFAEDNIADFEYQKLDNRESLALVRAFNRIDNPVVRKKLLSFVDSLTDNAKANKVG